MAAVTEDTRLATAARDFANELQRRNVLTHTGEDGSDPGTRMARAGYPLTGGWGEVAARGFSNAASVVNGWMNSPGHKAIILTAAYTKCGVGFNPSGGYWVGDFAV